jgi:hypothetical protein
MEDGKYGKPCIVLADQLQDAANVAVNQFWETSLNKVDLEIGEDGSISICQVERKIQAIKGADALIKAAMTLRTTAAMQAPTPPTVQEEESDEEKAM